MKTLIVLILINAAFASMIIPFFGVHAAAAVFVGMSVGTLYVMK